MDNSSSPERQPIARWLWQGAAILVLAGLIIVLLADPARSQAGGGVTAQPAGTQSGPTPAPWFYDAENDQHWHAPHAHWHPGPPPPPDQRQ